MLQKNGLYFWIGLLPILVSLFITLFILIFFRFMPPKLPLFYSLPWGEAQLGSHSQFLIIPATIVLINLINLMIFWQLHNSQSFFKKMLVLASLTITVIFIITFLKIFLVFV